MQPSGRIRRLLFTVGTLGEGTAVKAGLKGAARMTKRVLARNLAETVVVKETVISVRSKAAAGVGCMVEKEAVSDASSGAKTFLTKPTAGDNVGSKLSSEGTGERKL